MNLIYNKIKNKLSLFLCVFLVFSQTGYCLSPKTLGPDLIDSIENWRIGEGITDKLNENNSPEMELKGILNSYLVRVRKKIKLIVDKKNMQVLEDIILSEWGKTENDRDWVLMIEAVAGLNLLGKSKNKLIRQTFQFSPYMKLNNIDFNEVYKEFLFWFARSSENRLTKRDYSTYEKTYNAVIAIPEQYRTLKYLAKKYEIGGDKELLKACKKFKITVEYPDKESAVLALLERPIHLRTAKILKLSLEKGGNQRLLEAVRNYEIPLPNEKLINRPYQTPEDTLEAILALPNELRTKSKLKKHNYALYKAYHKKFEYEIKEKFKYEVPVEKGPKYPDVEATLLAILKRDPLKRNITGIMEDGEEALLKAFYIFKEELKKQFNYVLPRWTKYPTIEIVLSDLLSLPKHLRTAKMLGRAEEEGGNRALLDAARKYNIPLQKEYVGEYRTGDDVIIALLKLPEYQRTALLINRRKDEGGDPGLLSAYYVKFNQQQSENYGFELTKGTKEKYQTYDAAYYALRSRPKEHQSYSALKGASKYGTTIRDVGLLNACKKFGIPLYNDTTKRTGDRSYKYLEAIYPTPKSVYDAIMALPVESRTRGVLRKPKKDGGDKALHTQYLNFEEEIRKQFNYIMPKFIDEPMYRYHRDIALLGLLELSPEQRTATKLEKISKSLLRACRKFNIPLPEEAKGIYNSVEDVLKAILAKPDEERNVTSMQRRVEDGGDPNLVKAYYDYKEQLKDEFNYTLQDKVFAKYPDSESILISLLSIPKEERNHWHLDRKDDNGGNRTLLSAYYAMRKQLLDDFNFELENPKNLHYPTVHSVLTEYFKIPKDERTIDALDRPDEEGGNRRLLRGAKFHGIELNRNSRRTYSEPETTLKAILSTPKEQRALSLFSQILRDAYSEFKDEIKERFNYEVPHVDRSKYPTKESAEKALNEIPEVEHTVGDLKNRGNYALIAACKKFGIPLREKERSYSSYGRKEEISYYEKFRKKIIGQFNSGNKIDIPFTLWQRMKEGDPDEAKEAREMLFAYFIYFGLQQAEKVVLKNRSYSESGVSDNAAYILDDLINSAGVAITLAIDEWYPKISEAEDKDANSDFEIYVLNKISSAIKSERKSIFADYWRTVSISQPHGNKGGDNTVGGTGQFASSNKRTLGDSLENKSVDKPDEAIERFEKMMEVVNGIKDGDYRFFEDAGFEFDKSLVLSQEQKEDFIADLKKYMYSKGISNKIPGRFAMWVMGSMGRIGLARKGLSDVNLLIISDQPEDRLQDITAELRRMIGSGIIEKGNDDNYILTIGKHDSYMDMTLNSEDLLNLVDRHNLGDLENGIASIEVVSLDQLSKPDNKALNRAHFHVSENIYEMGANGQLMLESEDGFSKHVGEIFQNRISEGDMDYLFFMNKYLSSFLKKQVLKVINAHKYGNTNNNVEMRVQKEDDVAKVIEDNRDFERVEYFLNDTLRAGSRNGEVSLAFRGVLNNGLEVDNKILRGILDKFKGKEIYVDDPLIDENVNPQEYELADEQTNVLYKMLEGMSQATEISEGEQLEKPKAKIIKLDMYRRDKDGEANDLAAFYFYYNAIGCINENLTIESYLWLNELFEKSS